jgi:hypothetical protein
MVKAIKGITVDLTIFNNLSLSNLMLASMPEIITNIGMCTE